MPKANGVRNEIAGKTKRLVGEVFGDQKLHDEGEAREQEGRKERGIRQAQAARQPRPVNLIAGTAIMSQPKSNWIAAAELGIISSSFSTIVSQLFAARLGRDALVDWMTVAAIPSAMARSA